jgi:adenylylsulfate kinase
MRRKLFDCKKPTTMMLGRFQPWHAGHTALFKEALKKTGQVAVLVRDTYDEDDESNPYPYEYVEEEIRIALIDYRGLYTIIRVPNITHVVYGRQVGYAVEQVKLPEKIEKISATQIRKERKN